VLAIVLAADREVGVPVHRSLVIAVRVGGSTGEWFLVFWLLRFKSQFCFVFLTKYLANLPSKYS